MTTDNPPYQKLYQQEGKKPLSAVLIMVCIYIFLVIERPWESIRYLEGLQIERVYAILFIIIAFLQHKFKIVSSPTNKWVYGLLALHFLLAPFAFNPEYSVDQGIEYAKMVVLYLLMLSVADDEESLKILVKAYIFSTILYALHSLWEYSNGRHVWRMGIARMVGVDSTFNDPNAFGATIVLSLPFVYALLRSELSKHLRRAYYLYFALAVACVVLTGSRTSFVALLVLCLIWVLIQQGKRKLLILVTALMTMALVWNVMPDEKQERFRTLWDDEAGPANARASADGRMAGWKASWRMFKQQPFTGVGAGGKNYIGYRLLHQVDDGEPSAHQSHILYGEVLAEFGLFGAGLFLGLIFSIWRCCRWARSYLRKNTDDDPFPANLAGAILTALVLLLVFGIGGHNFYRPLWLWLAAWSGALYMLAQRKADSRV
jgi:O-antigen ligase